MKINIIYDFLAVRLCEPLAKLNNFPNIIQGIGLALLTILIPLAIAILADIYQKRKKEDKEYAYLDLHVILDNVFNIKLLIVSVFLIFLPMFFWEILIGLDRLIAVHFTFIGIILVVGIIFKVSRWVKGNVFDFRFSYLEKLRKYNDLEIVWKSIWQVKNINIQNERKFLHIFSFTINRLLNLIEKSENFKTISKLLNDFYNYINHRSLAALNEDSFSDILDWHIDFWKKEYEHLSRRIIDKKDKSGKSRYYSEISGILDDIFCTIEECSLKDRIAYSFFDHFEKHIEHYSMEFFMIEDEPRYYINSLLNIFCRVFFENIEKFPKKRDIWKHYFPEKWKIKKANLASNNISQFLCRKFLTWTRGIVLDDKRGLSRNLGNISTNLFPEVNPSLWITILLLFVFSHYRDNKEKIKSLIEVDYSWDFGVIGRVTIRDISNNDDVTITKMDEEMQEERKIERKNTFELAYLLFKENFSKENLEKYIKSLQELKYKENPEKENKRLELLNTFNEMIKFLNN